MELLKKIFNKKFMFMYIFLLLMIVFFYFYKKYDRMEIAYALIYITIGLFISLFYILKDFIYTPDRMDYKQIIMQDALFNHKGEILDEFEAFPMYKEFIAFHLERKSEDPYDDTVTSIQAVKYINAKMVDSFYVPLTSKDPLVAKYKLPLKEAVGRFIRYAGDLPIIIYNQPFTHTYFNVMLDKEIHISFIDAMVMSKDIYGIMNKPLRDVRRYLKLTNLDGDNVADAKVIGAIYLDYIYTATKYKTSEARKKRRLLKKGILSNHKDEPKLSQPTSISKLESEKSSSSSDNPLKPKVKEVAASTLAKAKKIFSTRQALEPKTIESNRPIQTENQVIEAQDHHIQDTLKNLSVSLGNSAKKIGTRLSKFWDSLKRSLKEKVSDLKQKSNLRKSTQSEKNEGSKPN
ncbi:MAG: hypothetical protein WBI17_07790 [Clostridiaceae bacterium]